MLSFTLLIFVDCPGFFGNVVSVAIAEIFSFYSLWKNRVKNECYGAKLHWSEENQQGKGTRETGVQLPVLQKHLFVKMFYLVLESALVFRLFNKLSVFLPSRNFCES